MSVIQREGRKSQQQLIESIAVISDGLWLQVTYVHTVVALRSTELTQ